ncbi:MAG: ECF-type sigma factor [Lysobacteraceae bacterium]|nr:ECF-type sigma factor [Xanthomonadaceae bacterium]HRX99558.1 ECF-type sigma factor [Xanthomonadaceae bacterium]
MSDIDRDDALGQITAILSAAGEANPLDSLMPMVHQDLKRLARAQRARMEPSHTLSTTALVNEAYLKLKKAGRQDLHNREHFFSLVARAMRQILIDHARSRLAERKRIDVVAMEMEDRPEIEAKELQRLLDIDSALSELEQHDERLAKVVLYRYFAGYSAEETAALCNVTERTINRDWQKARAWLAMSLDNRDRESGDDEADDEGLS